VRGEVSKSRATPGAEEEIARAARDLGEALARLIVGHARLVAEALERSRPVQTQPARVDVARLPARLTVAEVAELLRIAPRTVYEKVANGYEKVANGDMPFSRSGRRLLFDREAIIAWAEAQGRGEGRHL
jgi:Helix-turn-helix domain